MSKLKEALSNLAKEYKEEIQRRIVEEDLVDKGDLKNSIRYKMNEDGFSLISDEKYAYILGSNGYLKQWGRPPAQKLAEWAKNKGMRPMFRDSKGRFRKITDNSYLQLGFALAKSINGEGKKNRGANGTAERFGYRGSRIIQKVNQQLEGKLAGELTEAYKLDLIQGMKQDFKFDNIKIQ